MKITINSFKAVATWKWDLPEESDDTCGICRVNFEGTCSKCKFPGDDCPIIVGECRHCFHMVCRLVIVVDLVSCVEADSFFLSTASATGSPQMPVRANAPCAASVCLRLLPSNVPVTDFVAAFREKMAEHPPDSCCRCYTLRQLLTPLETLPRARRETVAAITTIHPSYYREITRA